MKKLYIFIVILLTHISCSEKKPHIDVAEDYCVTLFKHKVSELNKFATESTVAKAKINVARGVYKLIPDYNFRYLSDSVSGNRAWVTFDNPDIKNSEDTLLLVKIDGTWKVHFD